MRAAGTKLRCHSTLCCDQVTTPEKPGPLLRSVNIKEDREEVTLGILIKIPPNLLLDLSPITFGKIKMFSKVHLPLPPEHGFRSAGRVHQPSPP